MGKAGKGFAASCLPSWHAKLQAKPKVQARPKGKAPTARGAVGVALAKAPKAAPEPIAAPEPQAAGTSWSGDGKEVEEHSLPKSTPKTEGAKPKGISNKLAWMNRRPQNYDGFKVVWEHADKVPVGAAASPLIPLRRAEPGRNGQMAQVLAKTIAGH